MALPKYHTGSRGYPGYEIAFTDSNGAVRRGVIPAYVAVGEDGNPVAGGGGGGSTNTSPGYTRLAQNTPTHTKVTLVANTAQTIAAAAAAANGARILNWTTAIVYVAPGVSGTPASGAPSDFIPAAVSGVPGVYEPPYIPVDGIRAVGTAAGDLTVEVW